LADNGRRLKLPRPLLASNVTVESTQVVDFHDNNGDAYRSLITVLGLRTIIRF
jgi:hypothetical protein